MPVTRRPFYKRATERLAAVIQAPAEEERCLELK